MATAMVGEGLEADTELGMMSVSLSEDSASLNSSADFNHDEVQPVPEVRCLKMVKNSKRQASAVNFG